MKYVLLVAIVICITIGCSNDRDDVVIPVDGRYLHQIPDCDNRGNPEINCTEFVDFRSETNVDILIGGGDIVAQATYIRTGNTITIQQGEGANFGISFTVLSETQLQRQEDDSIWEKQ